MSTSRDAPNPLRPYYIPPSIGLPPEPAHANQPGAPRAPPSSSKANFSSARDIFSDLDYGDYLPERDGNSLADMTKRLVDQAIWNYTSVLLAQPFEVAKVVLQCHLADGSASVQPLSSVGESKRYPDSYDAPSQSRGVRHHLHHSLRSVVFILTVTSTLIRKTTQIQMLPLTLLQLLHTKLHHHHREDDGANHQVGLSLLLPLQHPIPLLQQYIITR
jgi:hypothetical protein